MKRMLSPALILILAAAALAAATGGAIGRSPRRTDEGGAAATAASGQSKKKLLYYRNPMGLPDTSPVPKKDPMGMDYVAVYEGEEPDSSSNQIKISTDKVQKLGVRSEPAAMRALDKVVKAVGRIEVDERRVFAIAPKFEGWVEQLFVNATGQPVSKGQPLFEVYSPELVSAQREYAIASEAVKALKDAGAEPQASMQRLADSSLRPTEELGHLRGTGAGAGPIRRGPANADVPLAGVRHRDGKEGRAGHALHAGRYRSTRSPICRRCGSWRTSTNRTSALVRTGSKAKVSINAYPDQTFDGRITYVYPTLKAETRTVPVRLEIANPRQLLKPAMFAQVELPVGGKGKVLTVPISAVIDSGTRRIVLVQLARVASSRAK